MPMAKGAMLVAAALMSVAPARAQATAEDDKLVAGYTLSLDKVQKALVASKQIHKLRVADPSLNQALLATTEGSLKAQMKALEGVALVVKVIAGAGLTTRDYSLTMVALSHAWLAAKLVDAGAGVDSVAQQAGTSAAQLAFVKQHRSELQKVMDELAKLANEPQPSP
jgi:hypothetical protein